MGYFTRLHPDPVYSQCSKNDKLQDGQDPHHDIKLRHVISPRSTAEIICCIPLLIEGQNQKKYSPIIILTINELLVSTESVLKMLKTGPEEKPVNTVSNLSYIKSFYKYGKRYEAMA